MGAWLLEVSLTQQVIAVSDDQFILRLFRLLDNSEKASLVRGSKTKDGNRHAAHINLWAMHADVLLAVRSALGVGEKQPYNRCARVTITHQHRTRPEPVSEPGNGGVFFSISCGTRNNGHK
jgi:hypothetical protein